MHTFLIDRLILSLKQHSGKNLVISTQGCAAKVATASYFHPSYSQTFFNDAVAAASHLLNLATVTGDLTSYFLLLVN